MLSSGELVSVQNNIVVSKLESFRTDGNLIELLLNTVETYGDKEILVDTTSNRIWKCNEIAKAARSLSKHLLDFGIAKGDVIAFYCKHNDYHTVALLAVTLIGGIYTGGLIDWEPVQEVRQTLTRTSAKYVIVDYHKRDVIEQCLETNKQIKNVFTLDDIQDKDYPSIPVLIRTPLIDNPALDKEWNSRVADLAPQDLIMINFSSGTTGKPKMVPHSHDNFATMISLGEAGFKYMSHDDVTSMDEPYTHVVGMQFLTLALYKGTKMIFYGRVDTEKIIENLRDYEITTAFFVPSQLVELNEKLQSDVRPLKLKKVLVAGEILSKSVATEFVEKYKPQYLGQIYGSTEGLIHTVTPLIDGTSNFNTVGIPYYGVSLKVVDECGQSLPPNKTGRFRIKGRGFMGVYMNDEEATRKSFDEDGFFDSGDAGYYDEKGYAYFVGRAKDIIKFDTMQISPAELEDILNAHPGVLESVVIGIPNEKYGQLPKAFVLLKDTYRNKVTVEELIEFAAAQTSDWKKLRGGITLVERFPKTKLGKIDRKSIPVC